MKREEKREIRRALMGRVLPTEDGRLTVMEKGQTRLPIGVSDGAGAVRFLGIRKKAKRLELSCSREEALSLARKQMEDIGRVLYLSQQPEAAACLIRYLLTRPAVLVFRFQEDVPVLTAWAGRGLTGWISNRRALRAFVKRMPEKMRLSEEPLPKDPEAREKAEARKQRKENKKNKQQQRDEAPAETQVNTEEEA